MCIIYGLTDIKSQLRIDCGLTNKVTGQNGLIYILYSGKEVMKINPSMRF